jgi:ABC-type lipoprotein export system ATPase subunit
MIYAGFSKSERKQELPKYSNKNLADRMDHQPNQLSGGQRQRGYCACFGKQTLSSLPMSLEI